MIVLLLIGMVPLDVAWFEKTQNDVLASKTYTFIEKQIGDRMPDTIFDTKKIAAILKDPDMLKNFQSSEEFKELSSDEALKDILTDEETAEQIKNKDYGALLKNPKMQEAMQNKDLIEKILAVNKRIAEEIPEESSGPRIIEIEK